MKKLSSEYPIKKMAEHFEVSRSGYYAWLARTPSGRKAAEHLLLADMRKARRKHRDYGSPRMTRELKKTHGRLGHNRVARLMRDNGLLVRPKRKFVLTTDSKHGFVVAENLLNRQFSVAAPGKVWVSDITYIRAVHGWMYLCVFIDLFSRRVVGWAVENHMQASLVTKAWKNALHYRRIFTDLIVHSDRGVQYCCKETRDVFAESRNVTQSMSRKGNCWDNACAESFFSTLKRELDIDKTILTESELRRTLFQYLEGYYNTRRMHSYLGYQTPSEFERSFASSSVHENG